MLLLIDGNQIIPDLFGRSIVYLFDSIGALGTGRLLVLDYVVIEFLIKGLLCFILLLDSRMNLTLPLLLPALRGGQVLTLSSVLRAILFMEGL
jgi:hypothetical protein